MLRLRSAWRWCFDVSSPFDPKLRGWRHPLFALILNWAFAFAVACAFFLATPSSFQQMWLQRQPAAVVNTLLAARDMADSVGISAVPAIQWLQETLGGFLLPAVSFIDKNQAFALYSWDGAIGNPNALAISLLAYVAVMLGCRLYEKGPAIFYDMAWACNMAMIFAALAIWLNIPFLVSACSCWIAVDQLLWYVDSLSLLLRGRFLIGVAKYLAHKDTPWAKKFFSTHHLWFIPLTTYINLKHAAGHSPCCLSVSLALSLACVLGSRMCTPYSVFYPEASSESTELGNSGQEKSNSEKNKGTFLVLNVNVAWRCWADVTHHLPILGVCDDKPWYMFILWNQLVWGLGNCFLFGFFLTVANHFRIDHL
ncbi:hypothetical protein Efla_004354 [Eimeria flavescens]